MKIILLPGMDGTGALFEDVISHLPEAECRVIPLPNGTSQSYESLAQYVLKRLPDDDFILVSESFSGPIGVLVAAQKPQGLRKLVFVATFVSPPRKLISTLCQYLPLTKMVGFPFSHWALKSLLLGHQASCELVQRFLEVVESVEPNVLRARLEEVSGFSLNVGELDIPAVYIQASEDRLVPKNQVEAFKSVFTQLSVEVMKGPHFILQAVPSHCANIIKQAPE